MQVRLGIVGCGGMAGAHRQSFDLLRDRLTVTATADVDVERAREAARATGVRLAVADYHDLLDEVDAVLVAVPHHLHHEIGMECLRAGKHVLMEKPLAIDEAQCLDLIHAARQRGLVLMVAYPMPYHPLLVRLKELLDSRAYGDIFQLSLWTEQHTEGPAGHWYHRAATLGGGQLFSHGCHYVDLMLRFLGRPVRGTHLGTNYGTPWMEREGTSHVAVEFAGGPLGYHFGTWGAKGSRLRYSFHAHCTEGMVEVAFSDGRIFAHTKQGESLLFELPSGKNTQYEISHFLDCVETGARPLTDGPRSLQGLRAIWRLYEAERRGVFADLRGLGLDDPWEEAGLDKLPG